MNGIIKAVKNFYLDMWQNLRNDTRFIRLAVFIFIYLVSTIYNYNTVKSRAKRPINWGYVLVTFTPVLNTLFMVAQVSYDLTNNKNIPDKIFGESNKK